MADPPDKTKSRIAGRVLGRDDQVNLPAPPFGVGFLVEVQNWSEQRQTESYNRLLSAKNELLGLLAKQYDLRIALTKARRDAANQAKHIDDFEEIASLAVTNELAELRATHELGGLRMLAEKEEYLARIAAAKSRRAEIENPTPPPAPLTAAERVVKVFKETQEADAALRQVAASIIEEAGGEANLTEATREQLEQVEIFRRSLLQSNYESAFE